MCYNQARKTNNCIILLQNMEYRVKGKDSIIWKVHCIQFSPEPGGN